jgi:hypothetical protein
MSQWTKKDIKIMCNALSSFWLVNRPLSYRHDEWERAKNMVIAHLDQHRAEIVISGVAQLASIASDRVQKNQETADHFLNHPNIYGSSTPEMVERFTSLARESQRDVDKAAILVAKIQAEGLPPEVINFNPTIN